MSIDPKSLLRTMEDAVPQENYFVYTSELSGNGDGSDSVVTIAIIPWKHWRVIGVGVVVSAAGASTVAELIHIGKDADDIGAADSDYFGILTQDNTADKQFAAGDVSTRASVLGMATPAAPANAGTHNWTAGSPDGLGLWQTKPGTIIATKKNVASSTATVRAFAIVELGDVR